MSTPSPLVIVRCKKCGTQLGSLDAMPDDWSGYLTVLRCRKCVIPAPRRLIGVLIQQKAKEFALTGGIPLEQLRPHAHKARNRGRTVSVTIAPITAAQW
jgi:hypothetical protein